MANLRQFLAAGAHAGQALKFYFRSTEIGTGSIVYLDEQNLVVRGAGGIPKPGAGEHRMRARAVTGASDEVRILVTGE